MDPNETTQMLLDCIHQTRIYTSPNDPREKVITRIMRYGDILPNLRISAGRVELPAMSEGGLAGDFPDLPDSRMRDEYRTITSKLMEAATDGYMFHEERAERAGDHRSGTPGRLIPLKIWKKYADMAVLGDDGRPIYHVFWTSDAVMAECAEARRRGELEKHVTLSRPRGLMDDYLRPCGLASCTRHTGAVADVLGP